VAKHTFDFYYELPNGQELKVDCTVSIGRPEMGPSYASGGEPAEDDEIEFDEVALVHRPSENQSILLPFDMDGLYIKNWTHCFPIRWDYVPLEDAVSAAAEDAWADERLFV
jgi:hypothetical protein